MNNFSVPKRPQTAQSSQIDQSNVKPFVDWSPSIAEVDSLITGEPLMIQVYSPVGEIFQYPVDERTTVESLLTEHVWKEKFFAKEPDHELYWLYLHVDKSDNFDHCLSKDKKLLKIVAKTERLARKEDPEKQKVGTEEGGKRFSFTRKKTSKFLRKQTIAAQIETLNENWVEGSQLSALFIVKKRLFSALHLDKNVKTLPKKALNFLFHQVRMDYIEKNLLKRLSNYDDVSLLAALIMKIKYWGKILRSKDNSLSKDIVVKNIDYAIPPTFLREKP
jgi:hypothetical protein